MSKILLVDDDENLSDAIGLMLEQKWNPGTAPAPQPVITLTLKNVTVLTIDLAGAGFTGGAGTTGTLRITSDTAVTVHTSARDCTAPANTPTDCGFTI